MGTEPPLGSETEPANGGNGSPEGVQTSPAFSTIDAPWFVQPDRNERLWRYMDLSKYLSMVTTRMLWFARADKLGDPYEGSMSQANVRLRPTIYQGTIPSDVLDQMEGIRRKLIRFHYISCWHSSEVESMAMWRLYMKDHGIAIVTSSARMRHALKGSDEIFLSRVNYVDFENYWIDEGNTFSPFLHKRKSFEHEHEIRAIIARVPKPQHEGQPPDFDMPSSAGVQVPADIDRLISEVRVAPEAPPWFRDAVVDVSAAYGLTCVM